MKPQVILTVGLQYGDESKGACVDFICRRRPVDFVCRYSGGSQCSHRVVLPDGRSHKFAQWGSGTFLHVPTYLGRHVIINPPAMVREANHLVEVGVKNPFDLLHVNPNCLVSTVYHQILNQAKELARGDHRHGSCGHGIGETRSYWLRHGNDAVIADDLKNPVTLRNKLELLRQRTLIELQPLIERTDLPAFPAMNTPVSEATASLFYASERINIMGCTPEFKFAVFEAAQGVLLDEYHGFHPHTTWSTVTPRHALEMTRDIGDVGDAEVYTLGIMRAMTTRHGAGPLPTEYAGNGFRETDPGNPHNEWQGTLRFGDLDMPLLRYAADVVRLTGRLDGIALNWLDGLGPQPMIGDYDLEIPVRAIPSLAEQEQIGAALGMVVPRYTPCSVDRLIAEVAEIAPVVIKGRGPTWEDRIGDVPL